MAPPRVPVFLPLGDGLSVRSFRRGDEPTLVRHANNPRVAQWLRDAFPHPYRPEDARAWVDYCSAAEPEANFALAQDDAVIGGIGVTPLPDIFRCTGEIGYWLGEPFWGRGITSRAVAAFSPFAFERFGLTRLQANLFAANAASARVLEKAGYTLEGRAARAAVKGGVVHDLLLYGLVRAEV
jgi:[ribosomal protein S5]-alanine N-acetyltransferase